MDFPDRGEDYARMVRPATNASLVELAAFGLYYFFLFSTGLLKLALSMVRPMFGRGLELVTKKPVLQMVAACVTEAQNLGYRVISSVGDLDKALQGGGASSGDLTSHKSFPSTCRLSEGRDEAPAGEELELDKLLSASESLSVDVTTIQNIVALTVDVTMKAAHRQFQNDLKAIIAKQMENGEQKKYNLNLQLMNVGAKC